MNQESSLLFKVQWIFVSSMVSKKWESSFPGRDSSSVSRQVDPHLFFNHKEVSLVEFYSYANAKICTDVASNSVAYVNTSIDRSPLFKICKEEGTKTYRSEVDDTIYELIPSNIDRHRLRINGHDVLLAEVGLLYEFVGFKRSEELQKAFAENIEGIPYSDVDGAWNKGNLPKYILASNGDVLDIQRRRKVLKFPLFSGVKSMFSKVLLFYPLQPNEVIDSDSLGKIYSNCK